jgi:hypothetical protein
MSKMTNVLNMPALTNLPVLLVLPNLPALLALPNLPNTHIEYINRIKQSELFDSTKLDNLIYALTEKINQEAELIFSLSHAIQNLWFDSVIENLIKQSHLRLKNI